MEDPRDPIVTVVVPAKDDGRFLRPCLRSIREQSFASFECVIVDDGSSDDTLQIAKEFAERDERFSVIAHETCRGPSTARNTGLANSSAAFVTFLDADDFLYPHSIERRVEALLQTNPDMVAGTFCDWQPTAQNEGPKPPERAPASRGKIVGFAGGPECPFIVTAPLVRREILESVGGFDEARQTAEDFDLWVRVLRAGFTFVYVPIIGVAYRQTSGGLVFSKSAAHAEASVVIMEQQYEDLTEALDAPLLSQPLSYYQLQCERAKRLLRTYVLAAASELRDDVDRIGRLIPLDLDSLVRAGLDVDDALRAGAWRASRAIPRLGSDEAQDELVQQVLAELKTRSL